MSFAIGFSIYIIYSTIIISVKQFNFYTIYLPLIVIDIVILSFLFVKKQRRIKEIIDGFNKEGVREYFKKNGNYLFIILIVFLMIYFLKSAFIDENLAYLGSDSYHWFKNILHVHLNGSLDYISVGYYTSGYITFSSAAISFTNDYYIAFYFLKYLPIFLTCINTLILFLLARKIFVKKINVYFTLTIFISFSIFNYRSSLPLPSTLATTLGLVLLLFYKGTYIENLELNRTPKQIIGYNFIIALLLTGIFTSHPLYGIFFLSFLFVYEIYQLIAKVLIKKEVQYTKISLLVKVLINFISIFIIFLILNIPYMIGTNINFELPFSIAEILRFYLGVVGFPIIIFIYAISFGRIILLDFRDQPLQIIDLLNGFFNDALLLFIIEISIYLIVLLGCIVIIIKPSSFKVDKKHQYLLSFFIFTFCLSFLILFTSAILMFSGISFISTISNFIFTFVSRFFELFAALWAILFVIAINYLFIVVKNVYSKIKKQQLSLRRDKKIFYTCQFISIILIGGLYYLSNYERTTFINYFDDDQTEAVLFAGNYFYQNPRKGLTSILYDVAEYEFLYHLIVDPYLHRVIKNFNDFSNYSEFKSFYDTFKLYEYVDFEFVLFYIGRFDVSFRNNFSLDFEILYPENKGYIFARRKL
jgi:hypothetical protein